MASACEANKHEKDRKRIKHANVVKEDLRDVVEDFVRSKSWG